MKHYLGICLVLVTLTAAILFTISRCATLADRTVSHVQDAFTQVFKVQPQITVNQRIVLSQTTPIAELAVVSKDELVQLGFSGDYEVLAYKVPLTEKSLTAEAVFRIKAGFDLHEPFRVKIENGRVLATLPHAKILSVEPVGDLTLHGADSVLNRISDDDRNKLLHDLSASARAQADSSSLKTDAEQQATSRLQEILARNGEKIQTDWISKSP